jgi:DsbC/DsbD-like thiol-disulfide interchange protein
MLRVSPGSLTIVAVALVCLPGVVSARAQDASGWDAESHTAARLIAGTMVRTPDAAFLRAGVEIKLDPGWHTYWRDPGDSGMPPTFDFTGSENVKSVTVQWPAPEQFSDGAGGNSIGYVGDVVLPLQVTPDDASRPASLHLKLGYAICANLCVPAEARLAITLTGDGAAEGELERAELRVPKHLPLGAGDGLAIRSVHREVAGGREQVVVELTAPADAPLRLFVEGPTPEWSLPMPSPSGSAASVRRFTFDLDGLPPGAKAQGATLTFTAVSGGEAIEVPAHLD